MRHFWPFLVIFTDLRAPRSAHVSNPLYVVYNIYAIITSDMQDMVWSLSEVVLRMVYENVMVMIVRMTVSVQSP